MLAGANSGDRSRVLRRIAPQPELSIFILGRDSRSPTGNSGQEFHTPDAIYRYFAEQSRRGYRRLLHRAWVQPINPHSDRRAGPLRRPASGPAADDPVVAIGFDITVRDDEGTEIDLGGKSAINCETGRFYFYVGG